MRAPPHGVSRRSRVCPRTVRMLGNHVPQVRSSHSSYHRAVPLLPAPCRLAFVPSQRNAVSHHACLSSISHP
eukprot:7380991-Prymnesium_polylepis.1